MIQRARFHCVINAINCWLSKVIIPIDKIYIKISDPFIEIVMPYLHGNHEIPPLIPFRIEGQRYRIISIRATSRGQDTHHIYSVEDSVSEARHEDDYENE